MENIRYLNNKTVSKEARCSTDFRQKKDFNTAIET